MKEKGIPTGAQSMDMRCVDDGKHNSCKAKAAACWYRSKSQKGLTGCEIEKSIGTFSVANMRIGLKGRETETDIGTFSLPSSWISLEA